MKKFHVLIILLSLLTVNVYGQRAIKGFDSFSDYREIGELRFWTFIVSDSVVGTLLSTVKEEISIDGSEGYRIEEKLKLDYNKANIALKMDVLNQHYVTSRGYHLGDKMVLNINEQSEKLEVFNDQSARARHLRQAASFHRSSFLNSLKRVSESINSNSRPAISARSSSSSGVTARLKAV